MIEPEQIRLLAPGQDVLVLLSGGRDSVCLLDLAARITNRVRALHLNYRLRDDSDLDQQHCEALCEQLGVPLTVEYPPGPPVGNLQAWARDARYAAASKAAKTGDVAVAHTASDQLETILYRLISSPSRRALLGMRPREGSLIRPLLSYTRADTTAYCRARGLSWRDDPSNASDRYVRNRIRNELVPLLAELHPGAEANVLALAELLRDEAEVLEAAVDRVSGSLAALREQPPALARLAIQRMADQALDGAPAAGVARRTPEILAMSDDAKLDLPSGVRAVTRHGVLSFERTPRLSR
ncbi:MAG: tRNA lysidine(34) synthetase TilS [Solirubrobacterales bacterium]|nr:tRNA lysidine(34) synthetase TilS [Solirubrobacterales bacterium]